MTREEAIEYFERRKNQYSLSDNAQEAENMAIEALKEPERVHGRWIHTGATNIYGGHQHKCSICGYKLMVSPMCDNENYCCNCGANMRAE